jgi:hypothetical protein
VTEDVRIIFLSYASVIAEHEAKAASGVRTAEHLALRKSPLAAALRATRAVRGSPAAGWRTITVRRRAGPTKDVRDLRDAPPELVEVAQQGAPIVVARRCCSSTFHR